MICCQVGLVEVIHCCSNVSVFHRLRRDRVDCLRPCLPTTKTASSSLARPTNVESFLVFSHASSYPSRILGRPGLPWRFRPSPHRRGLRHLNPSLGFKDVVRMGRFRLLLLVPAFSEETIFRTHKAPSGRLSRVA